MIERLLADRSIESFQICEHWSSVGIEGGYAVGCGALLRYIGKDRVFITNEDHGQLFGLGAPYNAESEIESRTRGKVIKSAEIELDTGDLTLRLEDGCIEIVCSSVGYENWQLSGPNGFVMVGYGGGRTVTVKV
jgi:hypothetical protein